MRCAQAPERDGMTKRNRELEEQLERLDAAVDPAKVGRVKEPWEARAVTLKESYPLGEREYQRSLTALARIPREAARKGIDRLLADQF